MHGGQSQEDQEQRLHQDRRGELSTEQTSRIQVEHLEQGLAGVEQRGRNQKQAIEIEPAASDADPGPERPNAVSQDQATQRVNQRLITEVGERHEEPAREQRNDKRGLKERRLRHVSSSSCHGGDHGSTTWVSIV